MFKIKLSLLLIGCLLTIPAHAAHIEMASGSNIVATAMVSWVANWIPLAFAEQKPGSGSDNLSNAALATWAGANLLACVYVRYHFCKARHIYPYECGPAYFWTYVLSAGAGMAMASAGRKEEEITHLKTKIAELETKKLLISG